MEFIKMNESPENIEEVIVSHEDFINYQRKLKEKPIVMVRVYFDGVVSETAKAYLIKKQGKGYWIPKKIIYEWDLVGNKSVLLPKWFDLDNNQCTAKNKL